MGASVWRVISRARSGSKESTKLTEGADMDDERIVGRSLFGGVDASDSVTSCCVGTETVDGFRRECDR